MEDHDILTIEEIAQYLRVSERTVYDWANKGSIPCGKLGTTWRFKRSEVEKWIDEKLSGNVKSNSSEDLSIAEVLTPERIVLLDTTSKEDALNALIERLGEADEIQDCNALAKEIFIREELMSTGIGFNVAVPHVRLDSVKNLVMAVGISKEPLSDYASLDEQPVRIVCMVAARSDQHAQYLRTLALVSSVLKDLDVRQALQNAGDEKSAYLILTQ
ncbi:MAG: PTS sugar transporter subunit IIA [Candidatus Hydrogenedentota bacterium]